MTNRTEVGVVRELYRYPVKSMAGQAVDAAQVGWHGVEGDRRYAFVRSDSPSGFPWLTARQVPQMLHYVPCFGAPEDVERSDVQVQTPQGRVLDLASEELRAELAAAYGGPTYLIKLDSGTFDELPLSLISVETVRALSDATGRVLDTTRFRPTIVLETHADSPFVEDSWLGQLLIFGDGDGATMRVNDRDLRCMMVNIDPATLEKDPQVLRTITQTRAKCLGVYGVPERAGTIRVGDRVRIAD